MANLGSSSRELPVLDPSAGHAFKLPVKCINDGEDVSFFLASKGYADIMTFIFQLNAAMMPRKSRGADQKPDTVRAWTLQNADPSCDDVVKKLAALIDSLEQLIEEAPPDKGPRRFGNISFRRWHELVAERISDIMHSYLPPKIVGSRSTSDVTAREELEVYLLGSFGSSQRLDYGSGHELSFLAFLGCLWKLGAFSASDDGSQERGIVLGVLEPYLRLVRRLILTYTLEPAGSHGVWGLDDHSFLPYVFGSAQYSPAISSISQIAMEGSLPDAPDPGDIAKENVVQRERQRNMYFSAIGFIYDVKKGPFWEHSPILFDISGVKAGWAKINKGMLKMYNAEVLSKFPVVQHFPFGLLFAWERDPAAQQIQASVHTTSQPQSTAPSPRAQPGLRDPMAEPGMTSSRGNAAPASGTAAPWASSRVPTRAPSAVPTGPNQPTRAPWTSSTPLPRPGNTTTAPWSRQGGHATPSTARDAVPNTRAPWAERGPQS